jgi:hypothetical protein
MHLISVAARRAGQKGCMTDTDPPEEPSPDEDEQSDPGGDSDVEPDPARQ